MKLLITTQKVDQNDDLLGFVHSWIKEFAKHCESIIVVCLHKGEYNLPSNVKVLSLEKENGESRIKYIKKFYKYIWQERKNYDKVFAHMNPEYVVLGGIFWRLWKKKISMWYTHKQVDLKLKIAEKLLNKIFTASKESCQIKSKKIQVVGHGIDVDRFKYGRKEKSDNFQITYVGRISKIKNQELLIRAADLLINKMNTKDLQINLVGGTGADKKGGYLKEMQKLVKDLDIENYVNFFGSVPNKEIFKIYHKADLSINLCPTGGVDKAVSESMASSVPVIALNKTFVEIFGRYQDDLILNKEDEKELAEKILTFKNMPKDKIIEIGQYLENEAVKNYSLDKLVANIIKSI